MYFTFTPSSNWKCTSLPLDHFMWNDNEENKVSEGSLNMFVNTKKIMKYILKKKKKFLNS